MFLDLVLRSSIIHVLLITKNGRKFQIELENYAHIAELYLDNSREPSVYYGDYLNTYIEKDLRQMIAVKDFNDLKPNFGDISR